MPFLSFWAFKDRGFFLPWMHVDFSLLCSVLWNETIVPVFCLQVDLWMLDLWTQPWYPYYFPGLLLNMSKDWLFLQKKLESLFCSGRKCHVKQLTSFYAILATVVHWMGCLIKTAICQASEVLLQCTFTVGSRPWIVCTINTFFFYFVLSPTIQKTNLLPVELMEFKITLIAKCFPWVVTVWMLCLYLAGSVLFSV